MMTEWIYLNGMSDYFAQRQDAFKLDTMAEKLISLPAKTV